MQGALHNKKEKEMEDARNTRMEVRISSRLVEIGPNLVTSSNLNSLKLVKISSSKTPSKCMQKVVQVYMYMKHYSQNSLILTHID